MESTNKTGSEVGFGAGYEWPVSSSITIGVEYHYLKVTNSYKWSSASGAEGSVNPNQSGSLAGAFGMDGQDIEITTNRLPQK